MKHKRKEITRETGASAEYLGKRRAIIATISSVGSRIHLRSKGCKNLKSISLEEIFKLQLNENIVRLKSSATLVKRGKPRKLCVTVDTHSGLIIVSLEGLRGHKSYSLADLFAWGAQLQLKL